MSFLPAPWLLGLALLVPLGQGSPRALSVSGHLRGVSGEPVCGAVIAAVPPEPGADEESTRPSALGRADCQGRYTLGPLEPGVYALTATLPRRGTAVVPGLMLDGHRTDVDLQLSSSVATLTGRVQGPDAQGLPGARVRAHRWSDDGGAVFYSQADSEGRFELTVPADGSYFLLALADGLRPARAQLSLPFEGELTFDLASVAPAPAAVVDWIRTNAIPLQSVTPGNDDDDLEPVRSIVGAARVVGFGTATHGTRESMLLVHRFLEFMVQQMECRAFAVEAAMTAGLALDDYVVEARGDPNDSRWQFESSEEMLELIEWMRTHNQRSSRRETVRIYGVDMQPPSPAAARVLDYLRRVDPDWASSAQGLLGIFVDPRTQFDGYGLSGAEGRVLRDGVETVLERLDRRRGEFVAASSAGEWRTARQMALLVAQNAELQTSGPDEFSVRDRGMADNALWILGEHPPDARLLLLGHNEHIALEPAGQMGARLRAALGRDYLSVGFVFDEGEFTAHEYAFGELREHDRTFRVGPGPPESLGATLAAAGLRVALLDLRTLPPVGPVAEWFAAPREVRNVGSTYFERFAGAFWRAQVLPRRYDVLLFVRHTTASDRPRRD